MFHKELENTNPPRKAYRKREKSDELIFEYAINAKYLKDLLRSCIDAAGIIMRYVAYLD